MRTPVLTTQATVRSRSAMPRPGKESVPHHVRRPMRLHQPGYFPRSKIRLGRRVHDMKRRIFRFASNKKRLLVGLLASALAAGVSLSIAGYAGGGGDVGHPGESARARPRAGAAQRHAGARAADAGERDPGQPQQGVGATADLPGDRVRRHPANREGLVHPAGRLGPGHADDLGVNYAPKLDNMAIGCPSMRADRDPDQPNAAQKPLRPGRDPLPGRARLQPRPRSDAGTHRVPAEVVRTRRRGRARIQPVHPDHRL